MLETVTQSPAWPWLWAVVLVGSLVAMIGFARAGSVVFWKCEANRDKAHPGGPSGDVAALCATTALVAAPILLAIFAGPAMTAMDATAHQLFKPALYIEAVLGSRTQLAGR